MKKLAHRYLLYLMFTSIPVASRGRRSIASAMFCCWFSTYPASLFYKQMRLYIWVTKLHLQFLSSHGIAASKQSMWENFRRLLSKVNNILHWHYCWNQLAVQQQAKAISLGKLQACLDSNSSCSLTKGRYLLQAKYRSSGQRDSSILSFHFFEKQKDTQSPTDNYNNTILQPNF